MQVSKIEGGSLRILISDKELSRFGASFASLKERDPRTKATIRRILQAVCVGEGLPPGTVLTVEAAPTDGGCLLLVTPKPLPPAEDGVHIFAPESADILPAFAAACRRAMPDGIIASALYTYENGYRLLLYTPQLPQTVRALLSEFAPTTGGGKVAAAHIAEYGTPIFVGDALERLGESDISRP